jgi:hypothetical protein
VDRGADASSQVEPGELKSKGGYSGPAVEIWGFPVGEPRSVRARNRQEGLPNPQVEVAVREYDC